MTRGLVTLVLAWRLGMPAAAHAQPAPPLERAVGPCVLVAPPDASRALDRLASNAESIVPEVSRSLGIQFAAPYRMVLLPERSRQQPPFEALDRTAPPWAAGFMNPAQRLGVIRLAMAARYPYGTPEAVLAHESAHQLLHDAPGVEVPLWFEEGVATWVAREWQLQDAVLLSGRVLTRDLPSLDRLTPLFHGNAAGAEEAYAAAFAFVSWSVERYGSAFVRDVIGEARTHAFERAWRLASGEPLDRAESVWRRECLFRYRWLPVISASSTLWLGVMLITGFVWIRKRNRARAIEDAWDQEPELPEGEVIWGPVELEPAPEGEPAPESEPRQDGGA